MKKLIYVSAFSLLAIGFVACSASENELTEEELTEDVTSEEVEELDMTIQSQEDAEKLDEELDKYIESLN